MFFKNEKIIQTLALISLLIGVTMLIVFCFFLYSCFSLQFTFDDKIMESTGNAGDFIGGAVGSFWALTGVFLLYATLNMQREELKNQREELRNTREIFEIQKFETTYFGLLEYQSRITENLAINFKNYDLFDKSPSKKIIGHEVFKAAAYNRLVATGKAWI